MHDEGGPNSAEFKLPRKEAEWIVMLNKMEECGFTKNQAIEIMKEKISKYIEACLAFHNESDACQY